MSRCPWGIDVNYEIDMTSSTLIQACGHSKSVLRAIPFVELMDLLEFSRLRLEAPLHPVAHDLIQASVIGTQDWIYAGQDDIPAVATGDTADIYICSTTDALLQAVLPGDETLVRVDPVVRYRHDIDTDRSLTALRGITLSLATLSDGAPDPGPQHYVRVDLNALISRVIVAPGVDADLFELVNRVVRSRIWVDVSRH